MNHQRFLLRLLSAAVWLLAPLVISAQERMTRDDAQVAHSRRLLEERKFNELEQTFEHYQREYEAGRLDDWTLLNRYHAFYSISPETGTLLSEWIAQQPKSYHARLARGIHYRKVGENRRGVKFVADTPPENLEELHRNLAVARKDLEASLPLTRKPIVSVVHLMNVTMHREGGRANRKWLDEAIRIDPNNFGARRRFMYTLEPRWGGSYPEMWAFLEECRKQKLKDSHLRTYESIIYIDQANAFSQGRQDERALPLYKKALDLLEGFDNNERRTALEQYARSAIEAKNYAEAISALNDLERLRPRWGYIQTLRGNAYLAQGRKDDAWRAYLRGAELDDARSLYMAGWVYFHGTSPSVPRDEKKGLAMLKRAADLGLEEAQKFVEKQPRAGR